MIILDVSAPTSVGTGLPAMLVNSSFGMFKRRGTGTVDFKIAFTIAVSELIGVGLGVSLLEYLKNLPPLIILGREVVAVQYVLLWAFILILSWVAGFMLFDYRRSGGKAPKERVGVLSRVKIPPYGNFPSLEQPRLSIVALGSLGLFVGFFTGLMGIGGGVILLPALIYLVGQRTAKAAGTSLLLVWIASCFAVILNWKANNINFFLWGSLVLGGLIGTYIGTKIGLKVAGPKLRLYFVYVVIAAILLVGYKILMLTFSPGSAMPGGH